MSMLEECRNLLKNDVATKIESLFLLLRNNPTEFTISFNKTWDLLGYNKKADAKESFLSFFQENKDYIRSGLIRNGDILTELQSKDNRGKFLPKTIAQEEASDLLMSSKCFKEWCMLSRTETGKYVRLYFLQLEEHYFSGNSQKITFQQDAIQTVRFHCEIAKMFKSPEYVALQEATKECENRLNVDLNRYLATSETTQNIKESEEYLEVTEIGKIFNVSGRQVNQYLFEHGYQIRTNEGWIPTEQGINFCYKHAWKKKQISKTGYNLKWRVKWFKALIDINPIRS